MRFTNAEAQKIIRFHLRTAEELSGSLNDAQGAAGVGKGDRIASLSNNAETHLEIAWYLIDKYADVEDPGMIEEVFRTKLHIGYVFRKLRDGPSRDLAIELSSGIYSRMTSMGQASDGQ